MTHNGLVGLPAGCCSSLIYPKLLSVSCAPALVAPSFISFNVSCMPQGFSSSLCLEFTLWLLSAPWPLFLLLLVPNLIAVFLPSLTSPVTSSGCHLQKFQMSITCSLTASGTFPMVVIVLYLCSFCKLPQRNYFFFPFSFFAHHCLFSAQCIVSSTLTHSRCSVNIS